VPDRVEGLTHVERVPNGRSTHQHHERKQCGDAGGQREQQADAVLAQEWPVALHAIDPVRAPLHLAHRRHPREDCRDPARGQRGLTRLMPALGAVPQRLGEDVARCARGEIADRVPHHAREIVLPERRREPDDRD
jgi:hypothetical protein